MNSTKLFKHSAVEGGFVMETLSGNYEILNECMIRSTISTSGLEDAAWDIELQAVVTNAKANSKNILSEAEIKMFELTVLEKLEDFDTNS